jgi:hypothetical protein
VGLVAAWDVERRAEPEQSRVILAYTRADVAELNQLARERLREAGELGPEQVVATERGERAFAAGDRVMFLKNERGLGVKNGTLGTVEGIEAGGRLSVRLDGAGGDGSGRRVSFELRDYGHVDHGYAATIHKAQGVTVDRAHVLASGFMDRHATYVALTRHRDGVRLHYGRDEFGDGRALGRSLSRERLKDTSLDYGAGLEAGGAAPGYEGEALARTAASYAERRGLEPLRPESEIVVRPGPERSAERASAAAEPAPVASRQRPVAGRSLRERLGGVPAGGVDPVGEARRAVGLERLRQHVREEAGTADPLAQARAEVDRLRGEAGRLVPGSLAWAAAGFQQAWGEVADYQARFGRALPEQERALEVAGERLERALPHGAEVLGEALEAGRARVGQGAALGELRQAAAARERAHEAVAAYRVAEGEAGREQAALEQSWRGTAQEREAHVALSGQRWRLAREVVSDPERAGVLERTAPELAEQARAVARMPEEQMQAASLARVRQLETERHVQRQTQGLRQSRGQSMGM